MTDPAVPTYANSLLRAHGLRPRKRWGQNFLCDRNVLDRIARAAAIAGGEHTLEIGAGLGALTQRLSDLSSSVTSIEIDECLRPILAETLSGYTNVRMVFADFLSLDMPALADDAFGAEPGVVVANIPYYITTPIIERLLTVKRRIRRIVLLVQQEVAERLAAPAGADAYGSLSVYAQFHCRVTLVGRVSSSVFLPSPDVTSAIITLDPAVPSTVPVRDPGYFERVVRAAFGQRRKTLLNALSNSTLGLSRADAQAGLDAAKIDGGRRAETLTVAEFAALSEGLGGSAGQS